MVQSTSISITPSQHADNHRTGGSDPLTGAVGIDEFDLGISPIQNTVVVSTGTDIAAPGKNCLEFDCDVPANTYRIGFYARRTDANVGYARIYIDGTPETAIEVRNTTGMLFYYADVALSGVHNIELHAYGGAVNRWVKVAQFGLYGISDLTNLSTNYVTH